MNLTNPSDMTRQHLTWTDIARPDLPSVRQNLTGSDQI